MEQFKINLLKLIAEHEIIGDLFWTKDLNFYVVCSDVFAWGCAESESIDSQEDVDLFEQAIKDCKSKEFCGEEYADIVYACRKRKMRPQGAMYSHINPAIHPLLDACGPEREIDFLNPKPREKTNGTI